MKPHANKNSLQIEKIQKRYTKTIKGCEKKSYEQRLNKLGVTSLADRHYRADMIQVYKILNDKFNIYPANFIVKSDRAGRTNSVKLFKKRSRLDLCKNSFSFRVVDQWNMLPDKVVLSTDVKDFKVNLDYHIRFARGHK